MSPTIRTIPSGFIVACLLLPLSASAPVHALPAFPGAEGWGAETPGGRGGQIVHVTNLRDSGLGSLREAIMTEGPRLVVFDVSGIIHLQAPIFVGGTINRDDGEKYSYLTVAGHSAPGGGVIVADYGLTLTNGVHDVVIRHLRVRNAQRDLEGLLSGGDNFDVKGTRNVVLDHCSASWSSDENIGMEENQYGNDDITVSYSLVAEGLLFGGHEEGEHSRGIHVSKGANRVSLHHNLMMSNDYRNPNMVGNGNLLFPDRPAHPTFDVRHNLTYNFGTKAAHMKNGSWTNWVGNLVVYGPGSRLGRLPFKVIEPVNDVRFYLEENASPSHPGAQQMDLVEFPDGLPAEGRVGRPFDAPPVTPTPVDQLQDHLLARVGARPLDATDARLLDELRNGTGSMGAPERDHSSPIPKPAAGQPFPDLDADGMPDYWEDRFGLDPQDPTDAHGDLDGDGYTEIEEYLAELSDILIALPLDDDFSDGELDARWSWELGTWTESGGSLVGQPAVDGPPLARTLAGPAVLPGCDVCTVEASLRAPDAGGPSATLVIGWSDGAGSEVVAGLLSGRSSIGILQKEDGVIVGSAVWPYTLTAGTVYPLAIGFDGERFEVSVDGETLGTFVNAGSRTPFGSMGLQSWGAPLEIQSLHVERPAGP